MQVVKNNSKVVLIAIISVFFLVFNITQLYAEKTNQVLREEKASSIVQINTAAELSTQFDSASDGDTLKLTTSFKNDLNSNPQSIKFYTEDSDTRNITIDGSDLELNTPATFLSDLFAFEHKGSGKIIMKNLTISASRNYPITNISKGSITLQDMTFKDARYSAIRSTESGELNIINCKFLNSGSSAIDDSNHSNDEHILNVDNSYFFENYVGGSVSSVAAGHNTTATIKNSTFENNISSAYNYHGGAVGNHKDAKNLKMIIENNSFIGNKATNDQQVGGAIALYHVSGSMTIRNNYFEGNSTDGTANTNDGGAIAFKNNASNFVADVEISGNTFLKNVAGDNAGALMIESAHNDNSYANIFNNTFVQNKAKAAPNAFTSVGGSIQVYGSPKTVISHNTFYQNDNRSNGGGGAIGINGNTSAGPSDTQVANNIFVDNTSRANASLKRANVAIINDQNVNIGNNGNVGYDNRESFIPDNAERNALVKAENIFTDFYKAGDTIPDYAKEGDAKPVYFGEVGSTNHKSKQFSYYPNPIIDEMLRTNDPRTTTGVLEDVRGYPREKLSTDNPYYPNAGAIELYWTKFDPGIDVGGNWSSRMDVQAENGFESLAYPGVFYKLNNPPKNGVFEKNNAFTRNTLVGPTGYGFDGWVDKSFNPVEIMDVSEIYEARKQTYTAQWRANIVSIDFDLNGGVAETGKEADFDTQIINLATANKKAIEPKSKPVKDGYTFLGWYDNDTAQATLWDFNKRTISADTTLYAMWKKGVIPPKPTEKKISVIYDGNGNTGGKVPVDGKSPYINGSAIKVLDKVDLKKKNHKFSGGIL